MSLTLTIGGTNFLPQYKTGSAQITNQIQNQGDSMLMTITVKPGQSIPKAGAEIIFKDGSRYLFGGFVTNLSPTEYGIGQLIEYQLEATDYTYLLINKSAQQSYESQTLSYIVNDLITSNIVSGYGLTTGGVSTGPTITTVGFNHTTIRKCFEILSYLTGYIWWVGYDKVIYFIDPNLAASAPESFTDTSKNHESVVLQIDATQIRNDITIIGGTEESTNYVQTIKADGTAREWVLYSKVSSMITAKLATVTKTIGTDPVNDETLFYFMYSPDRGSVRMSSGSTTPTAGQIIEITYTRPLPVITEVKDPASITALAAIEGGDGIHSYTITDTTITSLDQARERGQQEIAQYAVPNLVGEIITRSGLLVAGSIFKAGTRLQINMPSWGISTTTTYIIQKVVTTLDEHTTGIEYHYDITFGGRLLGVINFLQALAEPQTPIDTSGIIDTIYAPTETVTVNDSVAPGTELTNAETVSISDGYVNTGTNYGTIFVTGPLAPPSGTHRVFILNGSRLG